VHLSIILPTINERDNLKDLIPALYSTFNNFIEIEIVVVDDGSTDGTATLMKEFQKTFKRLVFLERVVCDGLPGAISAGISKAEGELIAWLDADGSMPIPVLFEMYLEFNKKKLDVIIGSRFVKNGGFKGLNVKGKTTFLQFLDNLKRSQDSPIAVILSRMLNVFLRLILNAGVRDITSGFILTKKNLVEKENLVGRYGEYFPVLIRCLAQKNLRIQEYGYVCLPRNFGISKTGNSLHQYLNRGIPYIYFSFKKLAEDLILKFRAILRRKI
jgi:glycosyltransferase involved in cell wall biosynthesis